MGCEYTAMGCEYTAMGCEYTAMGCEYTAMGCEYTAMGWKEMWAVARFDCKFGFGEQASFLCAVGLNALFISSDPLDRSTIFQRLHQVAKLN
jgi:hypothetical protein